METSNPPDALPVIVRFAAPPESAPYTLDWLICFGLMGLLFFGPLAFGAVEDWAVLAQQVAAAALLALWMFKWVAYDAPGPRGNALFAPLGALAAIVLAQLVFRTSAYLYATLLAALQAAVYYLIFFLSNEIFETQHYRKIFARSLAMFGAGLALVSMIAGFASPQKMYGLRAAHASGMVYGPYVNHSHYAGLMEMLTPFALVLALRRNLHYSSRMFWGFCALLMAGSIFLSRSRGGMVAVTLEIAAMLAIYSAQRNTRRTKLLVGISLGVFCLFILWFGSSSVLSRIATLRHPEVSAQTRLQIASDGLRMARAKPLLGWGLGTFATAYPAFRSFYTNTFINAAHNDYVQFLVELGFLGFAAVLWFNYRVIRAGLQSVENWSVNSAASARLAAALGAGAIMVHSFSDFNLQIPANAAMFFALCALATSRETEP